MNVDIHNHVIPDAVIELVGSDRRYGVLLEDGMWKSKNIGVFPLIDSWHVVDAKLREMDEKSLERAVLSAAPKPLCYYELDLPHQARMASVFNAAAAAFCAGHEDRLRWMAHVPLGFPKQATEVLSEALEEGACGVELGTSARRRWLDDQEFDGLWSVLEKLGIPVFLHPAYESEGPENGNYALGVVTGLPLEVTNALVRLICGGVLDRFPGVKVVAALGGGFFPYVAGRLRHYVGFRPELEGVEVDPWSYVGQIKFDTHLHDPVALRFLIEKAGTANVLIGSDCSFQSCTPWPVEELCEAVGGDAAAREAIASGNAMQMFWGSR